MSWFLLSTGQNIHRPDPDLEHQTEIVFVNPGDVYQGLALFFGENMVIILHSAHGLDFFQIVLGIDPKQPTCAGENDNQRDKSQQLLAGGGLPGLLGAVFF